jgi:mRNA interferase RelE/StbE
MFLVEWTVPARQDLSALPPHLSERILQKTEQYLAQNPRQLGEALTGDLAGLYRYRIGDYRVIYYIKDEKLIITIIRVGHRKEVYD